jgi:PLP dependent protein
MLSAPQNLSPASNIATNFALLQQRIAAASESAGRDVHSITLLAVSKGHAIDHLQQALSLGLTQFGENYVDEALPKIEALRGHAPVWHFIGRLQANKTRPIAQHFDWVHGIDRLKVAQRLSDQRGGELPPLNVCVQVNVADEATKGGVAPDQAPALLAAIAELPRLKLRGLMCMLPFGHDEAQQRAGFALCRNVLQQANARGLLLDTLSMGMSGDLEAAVQEGSTLLRIGTALFGPRG